MNLRRRVPLDESEGVVRGGESLVAGGGAEALDEHAGALAGDFDHAGIVGDVLEHGQQALGLGEKLVVEVALELTSLVGEGGNLFLGGHLAYHPGQPGGLARILRGISGIGRPGDSPIDAWT